jgi:hypothetical protein
MKFLTTTYKHHRESILFEKERALMPMTQGDVETVLRNRKLEKEMHDIMLKCAIYAREVGSMYCITEEDKDKEIGLRLEIFKCEMTIEKIKFIICNKLTKIEKKEFVKACAKNGCKGFLSTQWNCGICESKTCKDCGELVEENHECNEDNIKTQMMLAKDTKPCPKCASMIFKISGCDQMFCTECHTAFSWRTGKVETGVVHNPHYFEYQRTHGHLERPIGDIQCGGLPYVGHVNFATKSNRTVSEILRRFQEFQDIGMRKYRDLPVNNPQINLKDRISYMLNELSEADFKRKLQITDKDLNKRLEIGQIMSTLIQVVSDHFNVLIEDKNTEAFMNKYNETCVYFNSMLKDVSIAYQCSVPDVHDAWIGSIKY